MTFKEKLKVTIVAILTVVLSAGTVSATPTMATANYADTELSRAVNLGFGIGGASTGVKNMVVKDMRDLERFIGDKKAVVLPPSVPPAR